MASRRSFGSIRQLGSGRWQARYRGPDGVEHPADRTFERRKDAETWLSTIEADIVRGQWRAPKRTVTPVSTYVAKWIAGRTLKKPTRKHYEDLLRLHIAPREIGRTRLCDLDADTVRTWFTSLQAELADDYAAARRRAEQEGRTYSQATARTGKTTAAHAYRLLRSAMNTAVEDDLIDRNPCRIDGADRVPKSERTIASVDEVLKLADVVPKRYRALVLLAAFLGPRIGELSALRRQDVEGGQLTVAERVYFLAGQGYDYDAPKSDAGRRSVPLGAALERELALHLQEFVGPEPEALVFTTAGGKPAVGSYKTWWSTARRKIGRPDLRFHDLRHTGQTVAALSGATEAELMRRMGHSTTAASRVYMHSTQEHADAVAAQLSSVIETHLSGGTVVPLRPVRRRKTG